MVRNFNVFFVFFLTLVMVIGTLLIPSDVVLGFSKPLILKMAMITNVLGGIGTVSIFLHYPIEELKKGKGDLPVFATILILGCSISTLLLLIRMT